MSRTIDERMSRVVYNADGTVRSGQGGGPTAVLTTSPLSKSNWQHRIVVPLDFLPIGDGRTFVALEGAGHIPTARHPVKVNGLLKEFGESVVPPAPIPVEARSARTSRAP